MRSIETGVGIEAKSDAIFDLVEEGVQVERVATDFGFTEGPIWHPVEHSLLFSDLLHDVRLRYLPDGSVVEARNFSNKCNGMTSDADLNLIVCEHVTSSVVRESPDGSREIVAQEFEGEELNSPNDVVVHSSGAIYFTDPWYGRMRDVDAGGSLSNGRIFFENVGSCVAGEGVVDGMKCDEHGNVWVTGPGGIWVISSRGQHLGVVRVPEITANLTWGGEDWHTLFITSSTSLYAIRTIVGPRHEPYMR